MCFAGGSIENQAVCVYICSCVCAPSKIPTGKGISFRVDSESCANCRSDENDDSAQEQMRARRCECALNTGATREMPTKVSIYFLRLGRKAQRLEPPHGKPTFKARIGDLVKTTATDFFLLHTIPRSDELNPGRVQGMSLHCSQETPADTITMASAI